MKLVPLMLAAAVVPAAAQEVPALGFQQAINLALEHNPRLALARADIAARLADIGASRAALDTAFSASIDASLSRRPSAELVENAFDERGVGGSLGYLHRLPSGTGVGVSLSHRYLDAPGALNILAPRFTTDLQVSATQSLLRGFGREVNLAFVGSATTRRDAARLEFQRTAEEVVAFVALAYWGVAQGREEVAIRRRGLERAEKIFNLTQELIKRGSLPQAAIAQATSTRALRKARLQSSERILESAQATLVRAILDTAPVRVTTKDALLAPPPAPAVMELARADVKAAELRARALEQEVLVAEDRTRPSLDVGLFAGLTGLGGSANPIACSIYQQPGVTVQPAGCRDGGDFSGYGKAWSNLFAGGFYTAGLSATLALPVVNDGAEGRAAQARIAVEQARLAVDALRRAAQAEATSLLELALADRRAFQTAEEARVAATQLVDVEEQRYRIGSSTTFDVLRVQDELAESESLAAGARASILVSDVRYLLATGHALEHLGVAVEAP